MGIVFSLNGEATPMILMLNASLPVRSNDINLLILSFTPIKIILVIMKACNAKKWNILIAVNLGKLDWCASFQVYRRFGCPHIWVQQYNCHFFKVMPSKSVQTPLIWQIMDCWVDNAFAYLFFWKYILRYISVLKLTSFRDWCCRCQSSQWVVKKLKFEPIEESYDVWWLGRHERLEFTDWLTSVWDGDMVRLDSEIWLNKISITRYMTFHWNPALLHNIQTTPLAMIHFDP